MEIELDTERGIGENEKDGKEMELLECFKRDLGMRERERRKRERDKNGERVTQQLDELL